MFCIYENIFFPYIKNDRYIYIKTTKKDSEKKHVTDIKIFLKKKKTIGKKSLRKT